MAIRVLIVDDSATIRAMLQRVLSEDPNIVVVGVAVDGEEAIRKTLELSPDVITMDIFMPRLDGYEATRRIMYEKPTPIVVVSSAVDSPELMVAFKAIQAGALDVVQKPAVIGAAADASHRRLVSVVKSMSEVRVVRHRRQVEVISAPRPMSTLPPVVSHTQKTSLVVIASSTGGPAALQQILTELSPDFPAPIVVVQHMSAGFTAGLVRWLQSSTGLKLTIARHGERMEAGTVYFADEGRHLEIGVMNRLFYRDTPPVHYVRPSATVLFASAARQTPSEVIGVVLTGMGEDGVEGLRAMHDAGSLTIAQDQATCVVYGMPGAAVKAGAIDHILPIESIGKKLNELTDRASVAV